MQRLRKGLGNMKNLYAAFEYFYYFYFFSNSKIGQVFSAAH